MKIKIATGCEGPRHDPYSFQELTARMGRKSVTFHSGLGDYVLLNGKRIPSPLEKLLLKRFGSHEGLFTYMAGYSPSQLERWSRKARSRCRQCGGKAHHCENGYPGESLVLCKQGHIMDAEFHASAIE